MPHKHRSREAALLPDASADQPGYREEQGSGAERPSLETERNAHGSAHGMHDHVSLRHLIGERAYQIRMNESQAALYGHPLVIDRLAGTGETSKTVDLAKGHPLIGDVRLSGLFSGAVLSAPTSIIRLLNKLPSTKTMTDRSRPRHSFLPQELVIGLVQGVAFYLLLTVVESESWPASKPLIFAPLILVVCFVPILISVSLGNLRRRRLILWIWAGTVVLCGLAIYYISRGYFESGPPAIRALFGLRRGLLIWPSDTLMVFAADRPVHCASLGHRWACQWSAPRALCAVFRCRLDICS